MLQFTSGFLCKKPLVNLIINILDSKYYFFPNLKPMSNVPNGKKASLTLILVMFTVCVCLCLPILKEMKEMKELRHYTFKEMKELKELRVHAYSKK